MSNSKTAIAKLTCAATFATLRIYPGDLQPASVTESLGIEPSRIQQRGDLRGKRKLKLNGWFLRSEHEVESLDLRCHLDWILDQVESKADALGQLQEAGVKADVFCYWLSKHGHGGPTISPDQSRRLASLGLDCSFDIYFADE